VLTPRERDVLSLMAEGRSSGAIAGILVISERAVEKHISNIFSKLGLAPSDPDHRRMGASSATWSPGRRHRRTTRQGPAGHTRGRCCAWSQKFRTGVSGRAHAGEACALTVQGRPRPCAGSSSRARTDERLVAAQQIHAGHPGASVLILSQYIEPHYAMRLLDEHPERVGYLLKERVFDVANLIDALRRLADGETVVDPTIVARPFARKRRADPLDELTAREREVLALVAEGLSNRAIATRLFVTERTVEAHVKQIFLKLGISTGADSHRRVLAVLAYLRSPP